MSLALANQSMPTPASVTGLGTATCSVQLQRWSPAQEHQALGTEALRGAWGGGRGVTHSEPIRCELRASVGSVVRTLSSGAFGAERPSARSCQGGHHRRGRLETHTKRQAAWEQGQRSRCHHESPRSRGPWSLARRTAKPQTVLLVEPGGDRQCSGCLGNLAQSRFYLPSGRRGSEPSRDCLQLKQNLKPLALIRG